MNVTTPSAIRNTPGRDRYIYRLTVCSEGRKQVFIDEDVNLRVPAGKPFELSLPEKAGTGYRWCVEGIDVLDDRFALPDGSDDKPGQSGTRTFTVVADGPTKFKLVLAHPWEPDESTVAVKRISVNTH